MAHIVQGWLPAICPLLIPPIKVPETRSNPVLMGPHSLHVIANGPESAVIVQKCTMVEPVAPWRTV